MDLSWMTLDIFLRGCALVFFGLCLVGSVAFVRSGMEK